MKIKKLKQYIKEHIQKLQEQEENEYPIIDLTSLYFNDGVWTDPITEWSLASSWNVEWYTACQEYIPISNTGTISPLFNYNNILSMLGTPQADVPLWCFWFTVTNQSPQWSQCATSEYPENPIRHVSGGSLGGAAQTITINDIYQTCGDISSTAEYVSCLNNNYEGEYPGNWAQSFIYCSNEYPLPDSVIKGCTDPEASNYNPEATVDNGTCEYGGEGNIEDSEVDCNKIFGLPLWQQEKFCDKCEMNSTGPNTFNPFFGGPFGEFDESYCKCCFEIKKKSMFETRMQKLAGIKKPKK